MIEDMKFHHIGIACENIDETASHYLPLGYEKGNTIIDPLQNIKVCFLSHPSMPLLEFLAPVDEDSPIVDILKKNGTTPYHICYSVSNLNDCISSLRKKQFVIVSKPKIANAIEGNRVAFLYNKAVGLIELMGK